MIGVNASSNSFVKESPKSDFGGELNHEMIAVSYLI